MICSTLSSRILAVDTSLVPFAAVETDILLVAPGEDSDGEEDDEEEGRRDHEEEEDGDAALESPVGFPPL